jgi:hypothetical protein
MTDLTLSGGCLCGGVRFSYAGPLGGPLGTVTICHCAQCRRAQGLACAVAPVRADGFSLQSGADLVREYESSPGKVRAFCGRCGSPLYSRRDSQPDRLRLRLGALDDPPPGLKIEAHTFARDLPAWADDGEAPRFPGLEPGRGGVS